MTGRGPFRIDVLHAILRNVRPTRLCRMSWPSATTALVVFVCAPCFASFSTKLGRVLIKSAAMSASLDSVAKLWLRLRLDRDSVDQHCDSQGAVDDGAARARTGSILLQV